MTHNGVPNRFSFILDDFEISDIASEKLVAIGIANHHAKDYEFSKFVVFQVCGG